MKKIVIALIMAEMVLLSVGNLCGQHYLVTETPPKQAEYYLDYVRDVYILREADR